MDYQSLMVTHVNTSGHPGSVYPSCCESGTPVQSAHIYYFNDPLWNGSGCITSNCCDNPTQPWFYQQLNETTTDNIEARICTYGRYSTGSNLIDQLELYIQ